VADTQTIKQISERNVELLTHRPARGLLTFATTARLVDGLRCEIEDGPWRLAADMPAKIGGSDMAPSPGALGRGAQPFELLPERLEPRLLLWIILGCAR
jgi:hypothetical protein